MSERTQYRDVLSQRMKVPRSPAGKGNHLEDGMERPSYEVKS
jgi:hypothetical protein